MANISLNKLPWYGQLAVFVGGAAVLVGLFYYFYERGQQVQLADRAKTLSEIRGRISSGQATARQLPEFKAQVAKLEARLETLKPILPDERDAGELLRRVQTLAVQSNLVIQNFRPQAINTRELHAEWPISLQLEGSYHNLGLFLDRVSKFPRIINIGSIELTQKAEPSAGASMEITCTATTFVFVDPPPAEPEPTKKGKKAPPKKAEKKS